MEEVKLCKTKNLKFLVFEDNSLYWEKLPKNYFPSKTFLACEIHPKIKWSTGAYDYAFAYYLYGTEEEGDKVFYNFYLNSRYNDRISGLKTVGHKPTECWSIRHRLFGGHSLSQSYIEQWLSHEENQETMSMIYHLFEIGLINREQADAYNETMVASQQAEETIQSKNKQLIKSIYKKYNY